MNSKMTEAAKERLRQIAADKKGRDTLKGLDETLGRIAMDFVMEQQASGPLPRVIIQKDGCIQVTDNLNNLCMVDDNKGWVNVGYFLNRDEKHARKIPWVRLKQCPQWVFDEFANRWTVRKVAAQTYKGPEIGTAWETVTVVPLDIAVAWFRFLWPVEAQWGMRVRKYFTGFTEGWVQKYPGVGAKVKILDYTGYNEEVAGQTGTVDEITPIGEAYVTMPSELGIRLRLKRSSDKWEVIG